MRKQSQALHRSRLAMQSLVQKELQLSCEIDSLQQKIDLFETYYLTNTRTTGNVYMGWPLTSFRENNESSLKCKQKKTLNPIFTINEHEKLFSISSSTSKASQIIGETQYLTTRQLDKQFEQKIMIRGKKKNLKSSHIQPIKHCNFDIKLKNNLMNEQIEEENQLVNSESNQQKVRPQNHNNLNNQNHITNQNIQIMNQMIDEQKSQDQNQLLQPIKTISFALGNIKIQMIRNHHDQL